MQYFIQYFNCNPFRSQYPTFSLKSQDLSTCHFNLLQKHPVFLPFLCFKKNSWGTKFNPTNSDELQFSEDFKFSSWGVQIRGAEAQVTTYMVNVPAELFLDSGGVGRSANMNSRHFEKDSDFILKTQLLASAYVSKGGWMLSHSLRTLDI